MLAVQIVCGLGQFLLQGAGRTPGVVASSLPDLLLHLGVVHHLGRPKEAMIVLHSATVRLKIPDADDRASVSQAASIQ